MDVLNAAGSRKVWIESHPTEGWVPGSLDSVLPNGNYLLVDEEGEKFEVAQDKIRLVDDACLKGVDDLLSLGEFNEGALLHNIRVRYCKDEIYTGIGGAILISVNPYSNLPGLYSDTKKLVYREKGAAITQREDDQLSPHLFSIADSGYRSLLSEGTDQSIILSGESGAGKTEATKRILDYFASLPHDQKSDEVAKTFPFVSIEQQLLRSNPILEAFGNAKTIHNDNSSRFGKFIQVAFDNVGKLACAKIQSFHLEKNRIIKHQPNERGYHIMYQLIAGTSTLGSLSEVLHVTDKRDHNYTCECPEISGVNDLMEFEHVADCMQSLGFTTEERNSIFKIVAAVIHLGDLKFQGHADGTDGCEITNQSKADWICEMLDISGKDFTNVFQHRTLQDPFTKKLLHMPQTVEGSRNARDSMAKAAYSRLFDWLVWRINECAMSKHATKKYKHIGILDIFGFEVFEKNSFEQLCINFANEKLQQNFNSSNFTLEQRLYAEEGIAWAQIEFQDNQDIIDAFERRPVALFPIFDAEVLLPYETDENCLNKISRSFQRSKIVTKPRFSTTSFKVAHYAGQVVYSIESFLEKNAEKLHSDILILLMGSKMPLLASLFSDPRFDPSLRDSPHCGRAAKAGPKRGSITPPAFAFAQRSHTTSMTFRRQLDEVICNLSKTGSRYICCIKPNASKQPHEFKSLDIQRQLRCAGVLESMRIRKARYSVNAQFKDFFNRFWLLCPSLTTAGKVDPDYRDLSRKLLEDMEAQLNRENKSLEPMSWQLGRSKVFLKEEVHAQLEKRCGDAIKHRVLKVQKAWKAFKLSSRHVAMRRAACQVQAALLTLRAVTEFKDHLRRSPAVLLTQEKDLHSCHSSVSEEHKPPKPLTASELIVYFNDSKLHAPDD